MDSSLQNDYLLNLESTAPKPKVRSCRHLVNRPHCFGSEYHGKISREHSALLLRSDGEYLVRESASEHGYCLVLKINGVLKNYKLYYDGVYFCVGEKKFTKLFDLVADGLIHLYIEHRAKNYIETMSKKSVYAQLKASQSEEIDARISTRPAPYAEIPLSDHMTSYMTSSSSGKSMDSYGYSSADPVYETVSDGEEDMSADALNLADLALNLASSSSLTSKKSISNMSTGQSSDVSSDSYNSPSPSSSPSHRPGHHGHHVTGHVPAHHVIDLENGPKKAKRSLMTSLKRSLSFSQKSSKSKNRPKKTSNLSCSMTSSHNFPDYEKSHDFKVTTYKGKRYCAYCGNYMWGLIEQGVQCADCGINSHRVCSRLIPHDCSPNPKLVTEIFDTSLITLVKLYGTIRPVVVNICIQEIERRICKTGVYRENGDNFEIEKIRNQINQDLGSLNLAQADIHTVASILKLYLRNLPEPLVQTELYPRFLNAIRQQHHNYDMAIKMIQTALRLLHPAHYATLKYLIEHLERISMSSGENKMNAHNLGVCFGPVIFRSTNHGSPDGSAASLSKGVEEAQNQKELASFLITNRTALFH